MKKTVLTILLCIFIEFCICGCNKKEPKLEEINFNPTEIENVSADIRDISLTGATIIIKDNNKEPYVYGEWYEIEKEENGKWYKVKKINNNYSFNDIGCKVDKNNEVKFVMDWSKIYGKLPLGSYRIIKQVNNKYISIEFGLANTSINTFDFYITKPENHNDIKFNNYYTANDKTIYLAGNVGEFYIRDTNNNDMTLKYYLSNTYQTLDDSIKNITDNLKLESVLKDGAIKIYKSKDKDITMIVCNTTKGNKNIFIGDYSLKYTDVENKN